MDVDDTGSPVLLFVPAALPEKFTVPPVVPALKVHSKSREAPASMFALAGVGPDCRFASPLVPPSVSIEGVTSSARSPPASAVFVTVIVTVISPVVSTVPGDAEIDEESWAGAACRIA